MQGDQGTRDKASVQALHDGSVNVPVVVPPVEISRYNSGEFAGELTEAMRHGAMVVVDMTDNDYCDSSGISELVIAARRARAAGGDVLLVIGEPVVRRIFKMTGVDTFFRIFGDLQAAEAAAQALA